ncbi:MAG: energy-coupling factor transporter ATPase [Clostridia bacterium]|nr:energy-coupling factor transporter ATPase [Clostridia bacterium]
MSIKLEDIKYTYMPGTPFEKVALSDLYLEIREGEILALIGPTGSGKTTLLQHINGLLRPDSGSVFIDGEELTKKNLFKIRQKIGYVFQYPEQQLFEETVFKDIAFGLNRLKLPEDEVRARVYDAARLVGVSENLLERSVFDLSGGEKRRVAICGVLVTKPKYLMLDEPASGLDPEGKNAMLRLLKTFRDAGITVIFVSHNMNDVAETADRVVVINDGRIERQGTPREIFTEHDFLSGIGLSVPDVTDFFRLLSERTGVEIPDIITLDEGYAYLRDVYSKGGIPS